MSPGATSGARIGPDSARRGPAWQNIVFSCRGLIDLNAPLVGTGRPGRALGEGHQVPSGALVPVILNLVIRGQYVLANITRQINTSEFALGRHHKATNLAQADAMVRY